MNKIYDGPKSNISEMYTCRIISANTGHVVVRGKEGIGRTRGRKRPLVLSLLFLPFTSAGWPPK